MPTLRLPPLRLHGRGRAMIGATLVGIGLFAVVGQFMDAMLVGLLFLPILGLVFLLGGILTHHVPSLISGGVVGGVGAGVLLVERALGPLSAESRGGVFLLAFAGGWALITLLTALLGLGIRWWPLIPAGVLALVGALLLIGGDVVQALIFVGQLWPLLLVGAGLYVLFRREYSQSDDHPEADAGQVTTMMEADEARTIVSPATPQPHRDVQPDEAPMPREVDTDKDERYALDEHAR
jgi:hypothetical protein